MHINIPKSTFNAATYGPPTPEASPGTGRIQITRPINSSAPTPLATPPTTPPSYASPLATSGGTALLSTLFPASAREAAKYTTAVTIESVEADGSSTWWDGFILEEKRQGTRTLYINAQNALTEQDRVRGCIVALLDLAGEHLECDAVVMVLEKGAGGQEAFGQLVHSLLYVGGTVVTKPPYVLDAKYVLVGIEV